MQTPLTGGKCSEGNANLGKGDLVRADILDVLVMFFLFIYTLTEALKPVFSQNDPRKKKKIKILKKIGVSLDQK